MDDQHATSPDPGVPDDVAPLLARIDEAWMAFRSAVDDRLDARSSTIWDDDLDARWEAFEHEEKALGRALGRPTKAR